MMFYCLGCGSGLTLNISTCLTILPGEQFVSLEVFLQNNNNLNRVFLVLT